MADGAAPELPTWSALPQARKAALVDELTAVLLAHPVTGTPRISDEDVILQFNDIRPRYIKAANAATKNAVLTMLKEKVGPLQARLAPPAPRAPAAAPPQAAAMPANPQVPTFDAAIDMVRRFATEVYAEVNSTAEEDCQDALFDKLINARQIVDLEYCVHVDEERQRPDLVLHLAQHRHRLVIEIKWVNLINVAADGVTGAGALFNAAYRRLQGQMAVMTNRLGFTCCGMIINFPRPKPGATYAVQFFPVPLLH